jgi:hypothetical protein
MYHILLDIHELFLLILIQSLLEPWKIEITVPAEIPGLSHTRVNAILGIKSPADLETSTSKTEAGQKGKDKYKRKVSIGFSIQSSLQRKVSVF